MAADASNAKAKAEQQAIQDVLQKAREEAEGNAKVEEEHRLAAKVEAERKKKLEADMKVKPWMNPIFLQGLGVTSERFATARVRWMMPVSDLQVEVAKEACLPVLPRIYLKTSPMVPLDNEKSLKDEGITDRMELLAEVIPAILTTSQDCTVKIWNAENGQCEHTFTGHEDVVYTATWSPNSRFVVTASEDCTARAYNSFSGKCERNFVGHSDAVYVAAFASDSKMVATGSGDGTARLWSCKLDDCLKIFRGHTAAIYSISFTPDDETVVTISRDTNTKMWNRKTGICDRTLLFGSMEPQYCVSYSLDGASFACIPGDKTCKIMDTNTGQARQVLEGHAKLVLSAHYSPDVDADFANQLCKKEQAARQRGGDADGDEED